MAKQSWFKVWWKKSWISFVGSLASIGSFILNWWTPVRIFVFGQSATGGLSSGVSVPIFLVLGFVFALVGLGAYAVASGWGK